MIAKIAGLTAAALILGASNLSAAPIQPAPASAPVQAMTNTADSQALIPPSGAFSSGFVALKSSRANSFDETSSDGALSTAGVRGDRSASEALMTPGPQTGNEVMASPSAHEALAAPEGMVNSNGFAAIAQAPNSAGAAISGFAVHRNKAATDKNLYTPQ